MRRISIFIGLKIVEIVGSIFIFTACSALGNILPIEWTDGTDIVWTRDVGSFIALGITGMMVIFGAVVASIILYHVIKAIIKKNWEWSGRA